MSSLSIFSRAAVMALLVASPCAGTPLRAAELELLMVEQHGCIYCARWDADIAPEYPLTPEGRAAPLQRRDLSDQPYGDVTLAARIVYTPTFVLLRDGQEVGRLEGYAGEDFFWGMLERLIAAARPQDGQG